MCRYCVVVDDADAVVAAGYFSSYPAAFGDVELNPAGNYDAVLWKVNAEGTTLWAVRGAGTSNEKLNGLAVDRANGANAVVAAGYTISPTATFGGVVLNNNAGSYPWDAVVWKMSGEGTTLWAVRGGGTGDPDELYGVAVDAAGAVVAAGAFRSTAATFGDVTLTLAGTSDTVLWKLNKEGTTLWAVRGGGANGAATLKDVTVDGVGDIVAAGYFSATTATFGGETLNKNSARNDGSSDALLWKLSDEGTTLWVGAYNRPLFSSI